MEANEEEFEPLFDYSKTVDPCSLLSDGEMLLFHLVNAFSMSHSFAPELSLI